MNQFTITKTGDHGTSNPIVARLALQTGDIIQWLDVTEEKKEQIQTLCLELMRRLLNCYEIHQRLIFERDKTILNIEKEWERNPKATPFVIRLNEEIENFLYAGKAYLREVAKLVNLLFDANLTEDASIFWNPKTAESAVEQWAKERFGEDHETARMLGTEKEWVTDLVRKRNAVEHPGGHSGTIIIENFTRIPEGIRSPVWGLSYEGAPEPSCVYKDLDVLMHNMLTLVEDLLINAVHAYPVTKMIEFAEIPEDQRDKSMPKCLATVPTEELAQKLRN